MPRARASEHTVATLAFAPIDRERMLVRSGIQLIKYWSSITDEEQHFRFLSRIHDPLKQWKLSPMDLESRARWEADTEAKAGRRACPMDRAHEG